MLLSFNWIIDLNWIITSQSTLQDERVMHCFQAFLLPCFQYFQYFCNVFQYFQYILWTFFVLSEYRENKGQNWYKKPTRFSTLVFSYWNAYTKTQRKRGCIFLLLKYFLDNLFLTFSLKMLFQNLSKYFRKSSITHF